MASSRHEENFLLALRHHLLAAALAGFVLRLFFIQHFPFEAGDTKFYDELARNWLDHHVYGLFIGGVLTPVDMRAPGYPAFLAGVYAIFGRARLAVYLVQAAFDLGTCVLAAAIAWRLAPGSRRATVAAAALWLAALCPFVADYTAAVLTETLATFMTGLALFLSLGIIPAGAMGAAPPVSARRFVAQGFLAGCVVGLATLVRPESSLLALTVALVLLFWGYRRRDRAKLALAILWMVVGVFLPLVPWAARNAVTLGRVQFLAPRYAETAGDYIPHGFYAWTRTWMVRFRHAYQVTWKLGKQPIQVADLPEAAFDSLSERERVVGLIRQYNSGLALTPRLDAQFAQIARERAARDPLRIWLVIPLERAAVMWFTPRVELLPYSGELWPPARRRRDNPTDFGVTLAYAVLNITYVASALAGARCARSHPGTALLLAFILIRTAVLTQLQTAEPRYVIECFPVIFALGAQIFSARRGRPI